jgi:ribonuclease T2
VFRRSPTAAAGNFDFYVLSLSWSPGFCSTGGADKSPDQCDAGARLGFVVHGLWPQNEHGFPSNCDGARSPSRAALEAVRGLYPDEGLARHEWRTHGTCSGKSPTDYFADVRAARAAVTDPPEFGKLTQAEKVAPIEIARAFQAANPRLRPGMMAVACRSGTLQEVRICLTKDLRDFRSCGEVARGACRTREISVPAPQ